MGCICSKCVTVDRKNVPRCLKVQHIRTGYRQGKNSAFLTFKETVKSLFAMHNETLDIWTDIIGSAILLRDVIHLSKNPIAKNETIHFHHLILKWGLFTCKAASSLYHSFFCISPEMNIFLVSVDHAGILHSLFSSMFMVHNFTRPRRLALFEILFFTYMGIKVNRLLLSSMEGKVDNIKDESKTRTITLFFFVIGAIHPLFFKCYSDGRLLYKHVIPTSLWFAFAIVFYISRIPERYFKYKFLDLYGHSHTWWHILTSYAMHKVSKLSDYVASSSTKPQMSTRLTVFCLLSFYYFCSTDLWREFQNMRQSQRSRLSSQRNFDINGTPRASDAMFSDNDLTFGHSMGEFENPYMKKM